MIPKIVHYCWFGKGSYSELINNCINSWREKLPDYEFMFWNEDTFDINSARFPCEAYAAKKYAFVADYVRLYALKEYGGVYFDTDVEVLKSFDDLLFDEGFTGIEDTNMPSCGIVGCEKGNKIISEFFDLYRDKSFYNDIGQYEMTPNPCYFEKVLKKHGFKSKDIMQLCNGFRIYPQFFFTPHAAKMVNGR